MLLLLDFVWVQELIDTKRYEAFTTASLLD